MEPMADGPDRGRPDLAAVVGKEGRQVVDRLGPAQSSEDLGRQAADPWVVVAQSGSQLADQLRIAAEGEEPGASFEHLLGEPRPEGGHDALRVAPADLHDDPDKDGGRGQADPGHLARREERPGGDEQQAREGRPELARHPVHEREHPRPSLAWDDVVEGAPGGIREALLGDLLGEADGDRRGDGEGDEPGPEPGEVDDREDERGRGDPEPGIDAVRQADRRHERGGSDRRREEAEGGRQLGLVTERTGHRLEERERDGEGEDREEDVGDGDQPHERRRPDVFVAGPDLGDERRGLRTVHEGAPGPPGEECRHDGRDGDDRAVDEHEERRPDRPRDGSRGERPDEPAEDGGARADREKPLGLAGVEDGAGDRPDEGALDRPDDVHDEPDDREAVRSGTLGDQAEGAEEDGEDAEEGREEGSHPESPDGRPESQCHEQAGQSEQDVQVGQDARADAAEEDRVGPDLAEAATRLDEGEQRRHEGDGSTLARSDGQGTSDSVHPADDRRPSMPVDGPHRDGLTADARH